MSEAKPTKKKRKLWIRILLYSLLFGVVASIIFAFVAWSWLEKYKERAKEYSLDDIDRVELPSVIFDRNDIEYGRSFVQNRSVIPMNDIPENFIDALIAGEDTRYWNHDGVDYKALVRVVKDYIQDGEFTHGGSTITQQLARNAYNLQEEAIERGESSYERKLVEIYLAQHIESHFTEKLGSKEKAKRRILELYLNRIYFGKDYYGIRAASLGYYGKEPKNLTIAECASIVGTIKNPLWKSPLSNIERNKESRDLVLDRMLKMETITKEEYDEAAATPVKPKPNPLIRGTSYLHSAVINEVRQLIGESEVQNGGLKIYTTVDHSLQKKSEQTLHNHLLKVEETSTYNNPLYRDHDRSYLHKTDYLQGASISVNHRDGAILSYVGGRDFKDSQYDFIKYGKRPTWTAFLPFTYIAALQEGKHLSSVLHDEPLNNILAGIVGSKGLVGEFGMETSSPIYERAIFAEKALKDSKISASVRLVMDMGIEPVARVANDFGLKFEQDTLLRKMSIGSEPASLKAITKAYAGIAHGSPQNWNFYLITKILDQNGKTLYQHTPKRTQIQTPDSSTLLVNRTLNEVAHGKGNLPIVSDVANHPNIGVKTGSSPTRTDAWCVGWDEEKVTAVWAGFLQGRTPISSELFAKDIALPIWASLSKTTPSTSQPLVDYHQYIEPRTICSVSGELLTKYCNEIQLDLTSGETFYDSTKTIGWFAKGSKLNICQHHHPEDINKIVTQLPSNTSNTSEKPILIDGNLLNGADPYNAIFEIQTSTTAANFKPEIINSNDITENSLVPTVVDEVDEVDALNLTAPLPAEIIFD